MRPRRATLGAALTVALAARLASASSVDCSYWYETTDHGSAFRNVRDFGAFGDGVHDDTAAIQAALNFNQTSGAGLGLAPSAAVVYLPPGDYLISDTIVLWFWSNLVGSAACPPIIRLADHAPGFDGYAGLKPLLATNLGFNVTLSDRAWWVQYRNEGGHANDNFYVHIRDLSIEIGDGNAGAVGVLWQVAQQASIRNVAVDMSRSGAIAFDQGGADYAQLSPSGYSIGGGGSWEDLTVTGGAIAFRLVASQNSYRNLSSSGASRACVVAAGMQWAQTIVGLACSGAPAALLYNNSSPGSVLLLDSVLGPGLGPCAIITNGSALYLQNVAVVGASTRFVVDTLLPVPAGGLVEAWGAGAAYLSGVPAHAAGGWSGPLPLPSGAAAAAQGVPFLCDGALCGGSAERPATGLAGAPPRPSFVGVAFANARTDFGAMGDGVADDTSALRAALASGRPLFLPWGVYKVDDTLTLCNTTLVGEGLAAIALAAAAPGYAGPFPALKALLAVAPGCHAWVADITLTTLGTGNDGALLLDHRGSAASGWWDFHMRLNFRVGLKARLGGAAGDSGGGGLLSNCWWWGADHNLSTLVEMSDSSTDCTQDCTVGQVLGVEVTTPGPLLLLGTNFEHASQSEYNLTGAGSVVGTVIQTEGELASLRLEATSLVTLYGTLFGSSTGVGANHTATATRVAGRCVAALAAGSPAGKIDLSYRLLGSMQKKQQLLLVDDGFSVPGNGSDWASAALLRAC